jgi:hypothetical protein
MIDDGLRSLFHTNLRRFHWQAIESGLTGGGIPDSNFCINGIEGWVEHKATATNKIPLSSDQVGWHLRRYRAGGRTFIAVRYRHSGGPRLGVAVDRLYLYLGRDVKALLLTGLRNKPLKVWEGGPNRWDWVEIARFLSVSVRH